ncbi:hypothetical protein MLD38_036052 [Melastoma candidum]|uniref:Uncharacterized protein n=1 Tax=Melastoma candidum TaxID=119954 RepID=A0ACB9LHW3_9MYRT|nr:hypothetical protein MLD38_036052 [Melastoma candidum]
MEIAGMDELLVKLVMFLVVQALVYLILSNSSTVFDKNVKRSLGFKPVRSISIQRMLAAISDHPVGVEPSPTTPAAAVVRPVWEE